MLSRIRSPLLPISFVNCAWSASDSRWRTSPIFLPHFFLRLSRFAGRMKNPSAAMTDAMMIPVTSAAAVVAAIVTIAPRPTAPALTAAAAATALRASSASSRASLPRSNESIDLLRLATHRLDQPRAVVVKTAGVVADDAILVLTAPFGQMLRHVLPLPQVRIDQPVHQLADLALDLLRRVGDDLLLEALLHPAAVQQIHDAPDPHGVVEELVAALLHLEQDAIDVGDAEPEIAHQVRLVHRQLALDLVERREVVLQQAGALA